MPRSHYILPLILLFILALTPRLYSAITVGKGWFSPESYTVVNFDEANTCRAHLGTAYYSPIVGAQTTFIAGLVGHAPPDAIKGRGAEAKAYCLTETHMLIARSYSAVLGALTAVILALIALRLAPGQPRVAWMAGLLLALSGFHATQSHSATVDVAMTFHLYLFIFSLIITVTSRSKIALLASIGLLYPAVFAKRLWPMPLFGYLAFLPARVWQWVRGDMDNRQLIQVGLAGLIMAGIAFNADFQKSGLYPVLALFYLFVPWRRLNVLMIILFLCAPVIVYMLTKSTNQNVYYFTTGQLAGPFGTGFGAIGWNKIARNLVNLPVFPIMGLGILAAAVIPRGLLYAVRDKVNIRLWLCFLPVIVLACYLLFIAPRTTWRHYLPLLPALALLASFGFWSFRAATNKLVLAAFLAWPTLLLVDFELDFHHDPRRQVASWYNEHPDAKIFTSYYAVPPPDMAKRTVLFRPEFAMGQAENLKRGDYLVLSENWYDTAFANELNGPVTSNLDRLVKTKPEYATLYRRILAGQHPNLVLEAEYNVSNFMPELVLHKQYYGTFQKFVGDLKVFRIVP